MVSGNYAMVALLGHVLLAEHIMAAKKQMIHKETHVAFEDSVSVSFLHFCNCLHLVLVSHYPKSPAKVQLFFELCKHMIKKCTYCIKKSPQSTINCGQSQGTGKDFGRPP